MGYLPTLRIALPGNRLFAGRLAGHGLLDMPGPFHPLAAGARADSTTHGNKLRAPMPAPDDIPTFHCPEWPRCGCPDGAMRPECPGLKARRGVKP